MYKSKNSAGFTLLELIIVIIIISVISALAVPRLWEAIERAKTTEAFAVFISIRTAMERCFLLSEQNNYSSCTVPAGTQAQWAALGLSDPGLQPNAHFYYRINIDGTAANYWAIAFRNTNDGNYGNPANFIRMRVNPDSNSIWYEYGGVYTKLGLKR